MSIKKKILQRFGWRADGQEGMTTPLGVEASFELTYRFLKIGILHLEEGCWTFKYAEEFKMQSRIKPLPDFPDVDRIYESEELYPFFALRIPGAGQLKAKGLKLETEEGKSEIELLKRFGRETISNPFVLIPA